MLTCLPRTNAQVIFIEVSNSDEKFLSDNYRYCATTSPEYEGIDPAAAVAVRHDAGHIVPANAACVERYQAFLSKFLVPQ